MTENETPEGMTAKPIPPVVESVRAGTARLRGQVDPGWLASEVGLMRRNGIDPDAVLIDTYERERTEVRYAVVMLGEDGKPLIDRDTFTEPVMVTTDVVRTLEVYP